MDKITKMTSSSLYFSGKSTGLDLNFCFGTFFPNKRLNQFLVKFLFSWVVKYLREDVSGRNVYFEWKDIHLFCSFKYWYNILKKRVTSNFWEHIMNTQGALEVVGNHYDKVLNVEIIDICSKQMILNNLNTCLSSARH